MPTRRDETLASLLREIQSCTLCAEHLVDGIRPVLQADSQASILIAGQAPGRKVHASGIPFQDQSGVRLRDWMGLDEETFYDASRIAILPMGFCFPGTGKSGDLPPRPECAEAWRARVLSHLPRIELTLVIGAYAQKWHLKTAGRNLTETVRNWKTSDEAILPLPHPSPRNQFWMKKNPWFAAELLPELKVMVAKALQSSR